MIICLHKLDSLRALKSLVGMCTADRFVPAPGPLAPHLPRSNWAPSELYWPPTPPLELWRSERDFDDVNTLWSWSDFEWALWKWWCAPPVGIPIPRGDPARLEVSPGMVVAVAAGGGYKAVGVVLLPRVAPRKLNCLLWFGSGWSCLCKHQVRKE